MSKGHPNRAQNLKGRGAAERRQREANRARWNLSPDITPPEGYHRFGGDQTQTVKRHGGLEVVESGLRLSTGKLTLPEGEQ